MTPAEFAKLTDERLAAMQRRAWWLGASTGASVCMSVTSVASIWATALGAANPVWVHWPSAAVFLVALWRHWQWSGRCRGLTQAWEAAALGKAEPQPAQQKTLN